MNIEEYLDGLETYHETFVDMEGEKIDAKEYLKRHYNNMQNKIHRNLIPSVYQNPLGIQFELTYKCNQKCIHCYNQSNDLEHNDVSQELSLNEWKNIARQVVNMHVFQCVISGGEPTLLGDKLFEIMDILAESDVRFIVISNGMLLNEEMVRRFKKYKYSWFQISIDGSRDYLHDYIRGAKSFEKALEAANLIKEAGIPLVIAHSVMKSNKDYLEEMIDMAFLLGAEKIITGPFSFMGRAVKNSEKISLTEEECRKVYKVCEKKAREYSGKMAVVLSTEEAMGLRIRLAEPNGVMLIRPNGDVKFDCVSPFKIGNVKNNKLKEIWNLKGKHVYKNKELLAYIRSIRKSTDLLNVYPLVNVDKDVLL